MAYKLPSIRGRQDFPAPSRSDRAASYSQSAAEHRNLSRSHWPVSPDEIMRTRQQSAEAGIPIPPSGGWPTQGQVNRYEAVKEQLES